MHYTIWILLTLWNELGGSLSQCQRFASQITSYNPNYVVRCSRYSRLFQANETIDVLDRIAMVIDASHQLYGPDKMSA